MPQLDLFMFGPLILSFFIVISVFFFVFWYFYTFWMFVVGLWRWFVYFPYSSLGAFYGAYRFVVVLSGSVFGVLATYYYLALLQASYVVAKEIF